MRRRKQKKKEAYRRWYIFQIDLILRKEGNFLFYKKISFTPLGTFYLKNIFKKT